MAEIIHTVESKACILYEKSKNKQTVVELSENVGRSQGTHLGWSLKFMENVYPCHNRLFTYICCRRSPRLTKVCIFLSLDDERFGNWKPWSISEVHMWIPCYPAEWHVLGNLDSDLVIEQMLMRSRKSTVGLTRGTWTLKGYLDLSSSLQPYNIVVLWKAVHHKQTTQGSNNCKNNPW